MGLEQCRPLFKTNIKFAVIMTKLTQFSTQAGCSCKIQPKQLGNILKGLSPKPEFAALIAGNEFNEDASVMDLGNGSALIQTTDFFTPIVDDAYQFGLISAANAISDVFAMGGTPLMANAILGWPVDKLSDELATCVLQGAAEMCKQAGIPMAGGHSIVAPEPFFGLSVTGLTPLTNLKRNHTAQAGDIVFLTKKIGTGILATAHKKGFASDKDYNAMVDVCSELNKQGAWLGSRKEVTAMTDVTGFGLLGHLTEMCGTGRGVRIVAGDLPIIEEAIEHANKGIMPDSVFRNWNAVEHMVKGDFNTFFSFLNDPQTNGGLLFSVDKNYEAYFIANYNAEFPDSNLFKIGEFTDSGFVEVK